MSHGSPDDQPEGQPADAFEEGDQEEDVISLEALSAAYAQLIDGAPSSGVQPPDAGKTADDSVDQVGRQGDPPDELPTSVSPQSILEAMLFVGTAAHRRAR